MKAIDARSSRTKAGARDMISIDVPKLDVLVCEICSYNSDRTMTPSFYMNEQSASICCSNCDRSQVANLLKCKSQSFLHRTGSKVGEKCNKIALQFAIDCT